MTGEEMAKLLVSYANNMCRDDTKFVDSLMREHRTIQQSVFQLFMKCIKEWSKQEAYDLRNEHTIKSSKEIMKINNIEFVPFI